MDEAKFALQLIRQGEEPMKIQLMQARAEGFHFRAMTDVSHQVKIAEFLSTLASCNLSNYGKLLFKKTLSALNDYVSEWDPDNVQGRENGMLLHLILRKGYRFTADCEEYHHFDIQWTVYGWNVGETGMYRESHFGVGIVLNDYPLPQHAPVRVFLDDIWVRHLTNNRDVKTLILEGELDTTYHVPEGLQIMFAPFFNKYLKWARDQKIDGDQYDIYDFFQ